MDGIPEEECNLIDKMLADFAGVNRFWILMVMACFMISNVSRAIRWNMLVGRLGAQPRFYNAFLTVVLGYFANLGLPRMGEVVRAGTMARYEKISVEKVMGTVVADRIVDFFSLILIVIVAFAVEFNTLYGGLMDLINSGNGEESVPIYQQSWFLILAGIGLFLLVGAYVFRDRLLKHPFFKKVISLINGFVEGIKTIRKLNKPWLFVLHSINIWLMYYIMTYFCFFAFEPTSHLGPLAGLIVFVFGAFGIVIPSPGGMGTYHLLVIQALALYGIDQVDGFSFANICFFTIQLFCNISFGIAALVLLPMLNKNYHPQGELSPVNINTP